MLRYLRLYLYFLRFSFSKAMEFRVDFGFRIVMDAVYYAVNLAFYRVIFLHTGMLGGWNEDQALVFVGAYLVVDALNMTLFANNLWWLPIAINRGDLDYHLVRPVSSLFMLTLREFAANSFLNLLLAGGILTWALQRYPAPLPLDRLLVFGGLLLNGAVLYALVHVLLLLPVFWTHSGRGLDSIFWMLSRFMERPDRIFSGWVRALLLTVLPFGLMASFPARILLEGESARLLLHLGIVTVLLFVATVAAWNRALRAYASASS